MKDHQLGLAAYDPGQSFDGISLREIDRLDAVMADGVLWGGKPLLPRHIADFNTGQFHNPDGSYTPTKEQKARRMEEFTLEMARNLARKGHLLQALGSLFSGPPPAPDYGALAQGQLWRGNRPAAAIGEEVHSQLARKPLVGGIGGMSGAEIPF